MEILPLLPPPVPLFLVLIYWLNRSWQSVRCVRVYICMCVYCMYANITEGHILIKISVVIQLIAFSLAWVALQSQVFETATSLQSLDLNIPHSREEGLYSDQIALESSLN